MEDLAPRPGDLEPIETASRDEIAALQLSRMRWSLTHAYENSPFYRERFDAVGVHPSDLKTLADLAKFPFTTKKDLRDTYPFGMFAAPREKLARIHASSGTTAGRPWSATRRRTSTPGPPSSRARSAPRAAGPVTSCMWPMAMASSPAASAPITVRKSSAARWCRSPAA